MDAPKVLFFILSLIGFALIYSMALNTIKLRPDEINSTKIEVLKFIDDMASGCTGECIFYVTSDASISESEIEALDNRYVVSGSVPAGERTAVVVERREGDIVVKLAGGVVR